MRTQDSYGGLTLTSQETKREIRAALKKIRRAPGEMGDGPMASPFFSPKRGEMGSFQPWDNSRMSSWDLKQPTLIDDMNWRATPNFV